VRAESELKIDYAEKRVADLNSQQSAGGVPPPDEYEKISGAVKRINVWLMGERLSHFNLCAANKKTRIQIASAAGAKRKGNSVLVGSKTFAMTAERNRLHAGPGLEK